MPWGSRVHYKFIVDGQWTVVDGQPTEYDHLGNLNNVFDSPAHPPTPKNSDGPAVVSEPTVIEPTSSTGQTNGMLATVREAAVAMVEAIAPGTTETPAETPAVDADEAKKPTLETTPRMEEEIVEVIVEEKSIPVPQPESQPASEEVVLIEVPVLPLTTGDDAKQLETIIVEGSATSHPGPVMEPSTHTPIDVPVTNGHTGKTSTTTVVDSSASPTSGMEPSTHTPSPAVETTNSNGTSAEPSTHTPVVASETVESAATNGKEEVKPEVIPLPLPTPTEVPLPATPAANGNGKTTPPPSESTATTPQTSPRKEKKHAFPSFGRHSRRSSSSVSVSTHGTDEHGVLDSPASRSGTHKKKRTSSFFGKIKEIFADHEHHGHKK